MFSLSALDNDRVTIPSSVLFYLILLYFISEIFFNSLRSKKSKIRASFPKSNRTTIEFLGFEITEARLSLLKGIYFYAHIVLYIAWLLYEIFIPLKPLVYRFPFHFEIENIQHFLFIYLLLATPRVLLILLALFTSKGWREDNYIEYYAKEVRLFDFNDFNAFLSDNEVDEKLEIYQSKNKKSRNSNKQFPFFTARELRQSLHTPSLFPELSYHNPLVLQALYVQGIHEDERLSNFTLLSKIVITEFERYIYLTNKNGGKAITLGRTIYFDTEEHSASRGKSSLNPHTWEATWPSDNYWITQLLLTTFEEIAVTVLYDPKSLTELKLRKLVKLIHNNYFRSHVITYIKTSLMQGFLEFTGDNYKFRSNAIFLYFLVSQIKYLLEQEKTAELEKILKHLVNSPHLTNVQQLLDEIGLKLPIPLKIQY